ncbi:MAG: hypothetical protein KAZ17_02360, partial [Sphingorhabdus sp.]|nr:hypothetical protein [Sphingorhabdus sp.]
MDDMAHLDKPSRAKPAPVFRSRGMLRRIALSCTAICAAGTGLAPVMAAQSGSWPVESAPPPPTPIVTQADINSELLRSAIRRIANRPRDADALIDAGNASLALEDPAAALNFFKRADVLRPAHGRIKLGMASAHLRTENPFEALRLFDEAIKLGISERAVAADRAIAFDLLGNFSRAQQDYSLARSAASSDELTIKYAVSLSLSGKVNEADTLLNPLLSRNVSEAWRARAFLLAARGDQRESLRVTQGFMDARSVSKFEPFLRRMPELTGAQQAAAIHFGHFPVRNIGRDSVAVRTVAAAGSAAASTSPRGGERLIPSGQPFGLPPAPPAQAVAAVNPAPAAVVGQSGSAASGNSFRGDVARARILAAEAASSGLTLVKIPPLYPAGRVATPLAPVDAAQTGVASNNGKLILPQSPIFQTTFSQTTVAQTAAAPGSPRASTLDIYAPTPDSAVTKAATPIAVTAPEPLPAPTPVQTLAPTLAPTAPVADELT